MAITELSCGIAAFLEIKSVKLLFTVRIKLDALFII